MMLKPSVFDVLFTQTIELLCILHDWFSLKPLTQTRQLNPSVTFSLDLNLTFFQCPFNALSMLFQCPFSALSMPFQCNLECVILCSVFVLLCPSLNKRLCLYSVLGFKATAYSSLNHDYTGFIIIQYSSFSQHLQSHRCCVCEFLLFSYP